MLLFLDCEFTDFRRPALISLGLVDASGERCFYGVIEDFDQAACSEFVRETVLPKLHARLPACETAAGGVFRRSAMVRCCSIDWPRRGRRRVHWWWRSTTSGMATCSRNCCQAAC